VLIGEQVSLLTAADFWRTKSIPEKNIPAVKTSDGPNGARGGIFVGGTKVSPEFDPVSGCLVVPSTDYGRLLFSPAVSPSPRHGIKISCTKLDSTSPTRLRHDQPIFS
jgi:hypothetical protein